MFWLKMGEIASKCEHLAGVPLRPDIASRLHTVFLAKGVLATTAIEGNTLNEEQVIQQIDGTLDLPPSQRYLQQEIQNILDACNAEVRGQINDPNWAKHICSSKIKEYNSQVLKGLDVENDVVPGEFRSHSVVVGNVYRGAPAEDCEYLVDRLCEWLNGSDFECQDNDLTIPTALIRAIVAHVYLAWIHPFGDGNGRTARLVELQVLFSCGIPLPAAHLLSDHYNKTRTQYYRELNHASKSGGDVIPFITYALQGFLDGLREQLSLIRTQQQNVAWENYVHDKFRQYKPSPTQKRRRDLVLELTKHNWKQVSDIPDMSPTLAREYANAGERMLQRDLNAINKMDLILRRHGEVRARKELISAFLPATTPTPI
ncbi:MAG: Fic family protein [Verrucomicrobiota bacterium JB024]|nr:Fic family protein [Verrucomicrobiota bacterium JB024]